MFQNIIEILILSIVQGVSEFLPISSSAHLIVIESLYEFKNSSLLIDVSLHLGSLTAIAFFFRKDLLDLKNNQTFINSNINWIFARYYRWIYSIPNRSNKLLRDIKVIAWTTLIFGVLLFIADKSNFDKKLSSNLNLKTILFIGLFQILSLIPGVSRAGITITAARILKFNRVDSSKISFLLSIPALGGASFLGLKDIIKQPLEFNYLIILAIITSFVFSYMTVKFFLIYINKFSMNVFVIYRIFVAVILFLIIY